jgi:hypothetical protein
MTDRRMITREEMTAFIRQLSRLRHKMDDAEIEAAADEMLNPPCSNCGSRIRVIYNGPSGKCCHACYGKYWVKKKRMAAGPNAKLDYQVGDNVMWLCKVDGKTELVPATIQDMGSKRIVIQVPGESKVRRVTAKELAKAK